MQFLMRLDLVVIRWSWMRAILTYNIQMRFVYGLITVIVLVGVARFGYCQIPVDQRQYSILVSNLERSPRASAFDRDGNLVIAGHYSSFPGSMAFLYKISPNGQLLWSKSLGSCQAVQFNLAIDQLTNEILVTYYFTIPIIGADGNQLMRLRGSDGGTIWSKSFKSNSEVSIHQVGTVQIYKHETYPELSLKRLDPANGNEMWSRSYAFREISVSNQGVFLYDLINHSLSGLDPDSGAQRWTIPNVALDKTLPSRDGDIFVLFRTSIDARIAKISYENGQFVWNHQLVLMGSASMSRYDMEISDSSIVAGIGLTGFMGEWYKYTVSSRNSQNGNELGQREFDDLGTSRLIRSSNDTIFLQASPSKLVALSPESLAIKWTTEFVAPETYLTDLYTEPPVRSTDPLIFVSTSQFALRCSRYSKLDGERIWQQQVQPQHISAFQPVSAKFTNQGIVVSGNASNTSACLLLDRNLNHLETVEGDQHSTYVGTFPNGDVLFYETGILRRYSWSEGGNLWLSESKDGQKFHISPLGEIFALDSTGQYHTITKIDSATGHNLFKSVTSELVNSGWPATVEFGNDGNPVLIAYLVSKISRQTGKILFEQPVLWIDGFSRTIANVAPDGSIYLGFVSGFNAPTRRTIVRKLNAANGLQLWENLVGKQESQGLHLLGFSFDADSRVFLKRRVEAGAFGELMSISPANGSVLWRNTDTQSVSNGLYPYDIQSLANGKIISMSLQWSGTSYFTRFVTIDKITGANVRTGKLGGTISSQAFVPIDENHFATFHLFNGILQNSRTIATKFWSN